MAFTWQDKFSRAAAKIEDRAARAAFVLALTEYGIYGTEPVFQDGKMGFAFELAREDIDNSKAMRERGSKGGRPPKKPEIEEDCDRLKPDDKLVKTSDKQVLTSCEKPQNPYQSIPSHTNPIQSIPNQAKENGSAQGRGGGLFGKYAKQPVLVLRDGDAR